MRNIAFSCVLFLFLFGRGFLCLFVLLTEVLEEKNISKNILYSKKCRKDLEDSIFKKKRIDS
jgi:hypothetical protein